MYDYYRLFSNLALKQILKLMLYNVVAAEEGGEEHPN